MIILHLHVSTSDIEHRFFSTLSRELRLAEISIQTSGGSSSSNVVGSFGESHIQVSPSEKKLLLNTCFHTNTN